MLFNTPHSYDCLCPQCAPSQTNSWCTDPCTTVCPPKTYGNKCDHMHETRCIYYDNSPSPSELVCLGVTNGMKLNEILKIIDQKMCAINPTFTLFNLYCLRNKYVITDLKSYAEALAQEVCNLGQQISNLPNQTVITTLQNQLNYILNPQLTSDCGDINPTHDIRQVLEKILALVCEVGTDDSPAISATPTAGIRWTLSGIKNHAIQADINLSSSAGNQVVLNSDGLYVPPPSVDVPQVLGYNPTSQVITLSGGGGAITLELPVDTPQLLNFDCATKVLSLTGSTSVNLGCLTQSFSETDLVANDSNTITWIQGGVKGHNITAHVRVDPNPDNLIQVSADGLYVAPSDVFTGITADNALTTIDPESVHVQFGGDMLHDTEVGQQGYVMTWLGSNAATQHIITNVDPAGTALEVNGGGTSGVGIVASGGGFGVRGLSIAGTGGQFITTTGIGMIAQSTSGYGATVNSVSNTGLIVMSGVLPASFQHNDTSTSGISKIAEFVHLSSGTPVDGFGARIELQAETSSNAAYVMSSIYSKWTTVDHDTRKSTLEFSTVHNGTEERKGAFDSLGQLFLDKYGVAAFTGTVAKFLAVTSAGAVIETDAATNNITLTADNGLTKSTSTNVQLGSATTTGAPLLHSTYIDATSAYTLHVLGNAIYTFRVTTVGNRAIYGEATGAGIGVTGVVASGFAGIGVQGTSDNASGVGVYGNSAAGIGVNGTSTSGIAGNFAVDATSTNDAVPVVRVRRTSGGTPANNIGGYITFDVEYTTGLTSEAARIGAIFTDVTNRSSALEFTTKLNNAVNKRAILDADGQWTWGAYGSGTQTGTVAYYVAVTATGDVIETVAPGTMSADSGLHMSTATNAQLGGALLAATTISAMSNTNTVTWTGAYTGSGQVFTIANTSTGSTLGVVNNGGSVTTSIQNSGAGDALLVTSAGSRALRATSIGGPAAYIDINPSSTNTTVNIVEFARFSSGTPAANMGGAIQISLETTTAGSTSMAGKISALWVDPTIVTKSSKIVIQVSNSGTNFDALEISNTGDVEVLTAGAGLILRSPDGTRYKITVPNGGGSVNVNPA